VATRAAQAAEVLTPAQALAFVERHGIVCEASRRGATVTLVDAIAGAPVHGNWWSHPQGRLIFRLTRAVRNAPEVLVCRLVEGRITFVHERLWPALVRLAGRVPRERLARLREVHSASGKHTIETTPFPGWVPAAVLAAAAADDPESDQLLNPILGRVGAD
jgi:hypothetical protein